jgi:hypothetical protein
MLDRCPTTLTIVCLQIIANDDVEGMYHPMYHGQIFNREATLEECKMMGAMYVQASVDTLNKRFPGLLVFNTSKLFSPKYYPSDEELRITMLEK